MTVATSNTSNSYTGDGVITAFNFTFRSMPVASEIQVYLNQVLQVSGYTVAFNSNGVGGTVTFNTAPVNGAAVFINLNTSFLQTTTLVVEGKLVSKAITDAVDKLTLLSQYLKGVLSRAFTLSLFTAYTGSMEFPEPVAGSILRTNTGGTALEFATSAQIGLDNNASYTRLQHVLGYKKDYDHILFNDTLTVLAVTDANSTATINVKSESVTTDDLSFFSSALIEDGMLMILRAFTGHTITIRNNQSPGAGQIPFISQSGTDLSMTGNAVIIVQRVGNFVYEVVKAGFDTSSTQLLRLGGTTAVSSPRPIPSIPAAPTVTVIGTAGVTTRAYAVTDGDILGTETAKSANGQVTNANGTLNSSNKCRIQFPTVLGRIYKVYRTVASGTPSTTGLIATVVGTGGTVTVDDTNLAASTAAPTTTTLVGTYEHIGNYVTDGTQNWYGVTILIQGSWQNNHAITILPIMLGAAALPITGGYSTTFSYGAQRGQGLGAGMTGYSSNGTEYGQGGGGGSFLTAGGTGAALQTVQPATPAGLTYTSICQLSGSAGGAGVAYTTGGAGGAGGAGGGFGLIEATGAIVVNANITGDGVAGGAGSGADSTGGGGGTGAGLYLHSATSVTINNTFSILLRGGAGGAGGSGGTWLGGGGGGAGGYFEATSPTGVVNNGTVTLTGGGAGTSTSATIPATAGSAGSSAIGYNALMRRQAA